MLGVATFVLLFPLLPALFVRVNGGVDQYTCAHIILAHALRIRVRLVAVGTFFGVLRA
jgi:hypothetical protein